MLVPGGRYTYEVLHNAASATANGGVLECANVGEGAYGLVSVQLSGTFTATVTFEGTVDGTNYVAIPFRNRNSGVWATTATTTGIYDGSVAGLRLFRARLTWSAGTSITATALMVAANTLDAESSVAIGSIAAGTNNIGDVDVASIAAGETVIGLVGASDAYLTLTPAVDTAIYAAGDVLFTATELTGVGRVSGGVVILQTLNVIDVDDEGAAFDIYFFDRTVTFGAINGAPSINDTDVLNFLGTVAVATGDYKDLGGAKVACLKSIGLEMKPNATSLWVAGVVVATPTYTAATDLKLGFGFLRS